MDVGRLKRERESREAALCAKAYQVRRWTAFEWEETDHETRKDREQHLERMASLIEANLRKQSAQFEPSVSRVRVKGKPELLFEMVVRATDEDDARRRAMYRIGRGLNTKVPDGRGGRVSLSLPWGEAEVQKAKRPAAVA